MQRKAHRHALVLAALTCTQYGPSEHKGQRLPGPHSAPGTKREGRCNRLSCAAKQNSGARGNFHMSQSFFDHPILNSPYEAPTLYHALDNDGQPLEQPPTAGRRPCDFITPVPKPKRRSGKAAQASMIFEDAGAPVPETGCTSPGRSLFLILWRTWPQVSPFGQNKDSRATGCNGIYPLFNGVLA
jgi:hypothetical protein